MDREFSELLEKTRQAHAGGDHSAALEYLEQARNAGQGLGARGAGLESFDRQAVHEEGLFTWLDEADVRGAYRRSELRGLQP